VAAAPTRIIFGDGPTLRVDESPTEIASRILTAQADNRPFVTLHENESEVTVFWKQIRYFEARQTGSTNR
jgi:hypothetical protein